jgi:PIN domain nuclease of toxin-antitoxin system
MKNEQLIANINVCQNFIIANINVCQNFIKEIYTSRDNTISINLIGHDIVMISNGEIRVYDMDKAIDYAQFVARMKKCGMSEADRFCVVNSTELKSIL